MIERRKLLTGLIAFVAAPAIVRASSLMPVKQMLITKAPPPTDLDSIEWIGTYRIRFDEAGEWKLVRGPGFQKVGT